MYVVIEELIPEMSHGNHSNIGVLVMFVAGFTSLMMILELGQDCFDNIFRLWYD